jgi:hypothetical protein
MNYRIIISTLLLVTGLFARTWVETTTAQPSEPIWTSNSISDGHIEINFDLGGYFVTELSNGKKQISFPGGVPNLEEGAPDLPKMAHSIIIPDLAHMEISILEAEFIDISLDNISSSKGNLLRNIDPASVPYTYGPAYQTDQFYPENIVFMRDPYIMRTVRGQAIVFQPIQYNPIQRIFRVNSHIKIKVVQNGISKINPLTRRPEKDGSREFENMYSDHFLNYTSNSRYDQLGEHGPMLIIYMAVF